jgi:Ankyrin repeat
LAAFADFTIFLPYLEAQYGDADHQQHSRATEQENLLPKSVCLGLPVHAKIWRRKALRVKQAVPSYRSQNAAFQEISADCETVASALLTGSRVDNSGPWRSALRNSQVTPKLQGDAYNLVSDLKQSTVKPSERNAERLTRKRRVDPKLKAASWANIFPFSPGKTLGNCSRVVPHHPAIFSKDEDGFTPLHLAAANGYKDMAEFLLANKADAIITVVTRPLDSSSELAFRLIAMASGVQWGGVWTDISTRGAT